MIQLEPRTQHQPEKPETVKEREWFYSRGRRSQEMKRENIWFVFSGVQLVHRGMTGNSAGWKRRVSAGVGGALNIVAREGAGRRDVADKGATALCKKWFRA